MAAPNESVDRRLRRMLGAFLVTIVVLLAVVAVPALVTRSAARDVERRWTPARRDSTSLLVAYLDQQAAAQVFVVSGDPESLDRYRSARKAAAERYDALVTSLDSPGRTLARSAREAHQRWHAEGVDPAIAMVRAGERDAARDLLASGVGRRAFDRLRLAQLAVGEYVGRRAQNAERRVDTVNTALLFVVAGGAIVTIGLTVVARRWLRSWAGRVDEQRGLEGRLADQTTFLDSITTATADAMFLKDSAGRYQFVNRAAAQIMGRAEADIIGCSDLEFFSAEEVERIRAHDEQVRRANDTQTFDERVGDRVLLVTKTPYRFTDDTIGILGIAHDITGRRLALDRLGALAALSRATTRGVTVDEIARASRDPIRAATRADVIWIFEYDDRSRALVTLLDDGTLQETANRYAAIPADSPSITAQTFRSGARMVAQATDELGEEITRDFFEAESLAAVVYLPLLIGGRVAGVMNLAWRGRPPGIEPADLEFFDNLAAVLAEALARAGATAAERAALGLFQRALLPTETFPADVQIAVRYEPAASELRLGGDWYDVFELADGLVGIAVGDVVGHGIPAAAIMGQLRSSLRTLGQIETDPAALLTQLDGYARTVPGAAATTAVLVVLDRERGSLAYSCAGHPPPLVIDLDGHAIYLEGARGLPLGLHHDGSTRTTERGVLPREGTLVLYTDGLVERRDAPIDVGLGRLSRSAVAHRHLGVEALADHLVEELGARTGEDDTALICVRRPEPVPRSFHLRIPSDPVRLGELRQEFRAWLGSRGVSEGRRDDAVLAAMEAASNSIEHGYGLDGGGTIVLEATLDSDLELSVRDSGHWRAPVRRPERGRGMRIIEALADHVSRTSSERGTIVRVRLGVTDQVPT